MGLLKDLKSAGELLFYMDFRQGLVRDLAENRTVAISGTPIFSEQKCYFDGSSYFSLGTADLLTTNNFALYSWASPATVSDNGMIIAKRTAGTEWAHYIRNNGTSFALLEDAGGNNLIASNPINAFTWIHSCLNVDRAGNGQFYINGLANGAAVSVATLGDLGNAAQLNIGAQEGGAEGFKGWMKVVFAVDRLLTTTEIATLYSELENETFTNIRYTKSLYSPAKDSRGSKLLSYDFQEIDGNFWDLTNSSRNITAAATQHGQDDYGHYAFFNSSNPDLFNLSSITTLDIQNFTIDSLVRNRTVGLDPWLSMQSNFVANGNSGVICEFSNANAINVIVYDSSATNSTYTSSYTLPDNLTTHITVEKEGAALTVTCNGVVETLTLSSATTYYGNGNRRTIIGGDSQDNTAVNTYDGEIYSIDIYNETKLKLTRNERIAFATGFGTIADDQTIDSEIMGQGAYIKVGSGDHEFVTTAIGTDIVKVLGTSTAGKYSINTQLFNQNDVDAAYGYFDFWIKPVGTPRVYFVSDIETATSANTYSIEFNDTTNEITMYESSATAKLVTDGSYITSGVWTHIGIERFVDGNTTLYINDRKADFIATGTNPWQDTTVTSSSYVVFDMDAGTQLGIADKNNKYQFIKKDIL